MTTVQAESCVQSRYSPLGQSITGNAICLNPEGGGYLKIIQIKPDCKTVNNGAGLSVKCDIALFHIGQLVLNSNYCVRLGQDEVRSHYDLNLKR